MTLHDDLMGRNIACDAVDCAEVNGTGVRAHVHFYDDEKDPYLSPELTGWLLGVDYGDGTPVNDFCPDCAD